MYWNGNIGGGSTVNPHLLPNSRRAASHRHHTINGYIAAGGREWWRLPPIPFHDILYPSAHEWNASTGLLYAYLDTTTISSTILSSTVIHPMHCVHPRQLCWLERFRWWVPGGRAFSVVAPLLWNSFPKDAHLAWSLTAFRRQVELFRRAFNSISQNYLASFWVLRHLFMYGNFNWVFICLLFMIYAFWNYC